MQPAAAPADLPTVLPARRKKSALIWTILAAVVFIGWWRSYRTVDVIKHPTHVGDRVCITSEFGLLVLEWHAPQEGGPEAGEPQPTWVYMYTPVPRRWPARWQWLGFDAYHGEYRHYLLLQPGGVYGVAIPYWFIMLALASCAIGAWTRFGKRTRAQNRVGRGCCAVCGYDLRGTPTQCPECGAAAGTQATLSAVSARGMGSSEIEGTAGARRFLTVVNANTAANADTPAQITRA